MNTLETTVRRPIEQTITEALATCGSQVERTGSGTWAVKKGRACRIDARLNGGWLTCRVPLFRASTRRNGWEHARANAEIGGCTRIAIEPTDFSLHLRTDVLIDSNGDTAQWCARAVSDLLAAREQLRYSTVEPSPPQEAGDDAPPSEEIQDLCREAGWVFVERENGPVTVNLNVHGSFHQAQIYVTPRGEVRASVMLARYDSLSDAQRDSLAVIILTVNGVVRLVRGAVKQEEERTRCFFEVQFSELPSVDTIDRALGALSTASSLCGRELQCLADEQVGRRFLAVRGIDPASPLVSFRGDVTQPPTQARRKKRCRTKTRASNSK